MDIADRLIEIDDAIAAIRARYLAKARGPVTDGHLPGAAWFKECGEQMSRDPEMVELQRERGAVSAPVVGICSHEGCMYLATQGGLFQIVEGNRLRLIEFDWTRP